MREFITPRSRTLLHHANPITKLVIMISLFMITILTNSLDFIICQAFIFTLLLFLLSGHPVWKVLLFISPFLLIFVSSSTTMIMFGKGDTLWWEWGIIRITEESFFRGIHVGFKAVTFASEGLLFVLTTSSVSLFYSLMQKWKLPPKYAYSFMASIRLLPMVWEELQIRRNALQIRGVTSSRGIRRLFETVKLYAVPLLSQSIRRAHRVAVAMESKSFDSDKSRTYYYSSVMTYYDLLVLLLFASAVAAAIAVSTVYPLFGISDVR